jgi:hypothetical protein
MHALALDGERGAALDQLLSGTRRLHQAGLELEPETAALGERIRRGKDLRLAAETRTAADLYSRRAPLSGRADELGRLLQTWKTCREAQRAAVLVIHGDAGTGKTRLLEELLDRVRLEPAIGVAARAVEADVHEPWSLVFALAGGGLLDAAGLSAAQPEALSTIAARVPAWRERFPGVSGATSLSPAQALTDVLNAVLEEQPLLLAIDDAHWADSSTLLALAALMRDLSRTPLLVCLTTTDGAARQEIDALRVRIPRDVPGAVVGLGPLPVDAIRDLATWALPRYSETEADRVSRRIGMDSAALPLLVIELLHAVALGLDLRETTGAWPQPFRTLSHTLPGDLPDAVVAAIRIGYRRLTMPAQRALAAAAVLGDRELAARIGKGSGLSGDVLAESLDELEWQRWLTADPRGYRFVARIARDVIAQDMVMPGQRERIIAAANERDS